MLRHALSLTIVELRSLFGFNEAVHERDKKKKRRLMLLGATYVFIVAMMTAYVALFAYGMSVIGLTDVIPAVICVVISLITLAFTFFKAGATLFNLNTYERLIALPIRPASIVLSRFITMYIPNAAMAILAGLAGYGVWAYFTKPKFIQYLFLALGTVITPLIPMAIACALGALVYAAASRMKHKNIVNIVLALIVTLALIILPAALSSNSMDIASLINLSRAVINAATRLYAPSEWFSDAVLELNWASFALFAISSLAVFAAAVALTRWKFTDICRALSARRTHGDFKLSGQKRKGLIYALYRKELSRYMASPIYVLNTVIGYVMMLLGSVMIVVFGIDKIEQAIPVGILEKFLPLAFCALCAMTTTTSSSISIEGKQWWIMQTLPVPASVIFLGKILVQFTVALPFYIASCLIVSFTVKTTVLGLATMWITPLCYIAFTAVLGVFINTKMPSFNWDNDTAVVKQSASVGISMLLGIASVMIPVAAAILIPGVSINAVCLIASLLVSAATAIMYRYISNIDLCRING